MGTSEIKPGGGLGVMLCPKSLPEMVLQETIAASECFRRDESYDRYLRLDDYYRRKDDSYYDRYKEPEGECLHVKGRVPWCRSATVVVLCAPLSRSEGCHSSCPCGSFQTA